MARDSDLVRRGRGEFALADSTLEQAFVAHRHDLIRFLGRRLRCLFTARDIAQEVYFKTLRVDEREKVDNPRALLFEIAANLAVDHQRVEGRRAEILEEARELLWSGDDEASPERHVLARDELERIQAALLRLPERSRQIFYLNRFEGLTQREICARLGISRTSVEKHMRRALRCVSDTRRLLDGEGEGAPEGPPKREIGKGG